MRAWSGENIKVVSLTEIVYPSPFISVVASNIHAFIVVCFSESNFVFFPTEDLILAG